MVLLSREEMQIRPKVEGDRNDFFLQNITILIDCTSQLAQQQ